MGFQYNKNKGPGEGQEWGSYSDLFLALSVIFLFLYITASLRTGTSNLQGQAEQQRLARENEDLRQQLKVYSTLKQDYLEKQASEDEQEAYKELMDKLKLLQEEQKQEAKALRAQAQENEKKEVALNKYQQMIRNIMNANMIQKSRIKVRDEVIEEKKEQIVAKDQTIDELEQTVEEKKKAIAEREQKIKSANAELEQRMKQLKQAFQQNKITKKNYESQQAKLKQQVQQQVSQLKEQNQQITAQLSEINSALSAKERELASTKTQVQQTTAEKAKLTAELQANAQKSAQHIAAMKAQAEREREQARAQFEAEMAKQQLSAQARAAKEAQYRAQAAAKERELATQIASLGEKMKENEGEISKLKEIANARKKLAEQIKANFAKVGVKADVDAGTGDVVIDFGDQYFDTGRADLKPKMKGVLEKAMPSYASSLFSDPKIAEKITGVEIIGFASPTYKGKVVDPTSLSPDDRKAVDYNLDLSYSRAKAIFNHAFDTNKMNFPHQKKMLPLVKVTGRSFLAEAKDGRKLAGAGEKDFCQVNDCKKAQRVIIKFNLGE